MDLEALLRVGVDKEASDIHLKVGAPPMFRVHGHIERFGEECIESKDLLGLMDQFLNDETQQAFEVTKDIDVGHMIKGVARFRVNVAYADNEPRITFRIIPVTTPTLDELNMPPVLKDICKHKTGLVLVTGPTGAGKSTTLAAMLDEINTNYPYHIVTVEDPIEFVHPDKKSTLTQRQVGIDTTSFANAMRAALRQDPDVILIGEMRDAETVATAMSCAETGHLVLSTLHTVNAAETLDRVIEFFPSGQQEQMRKQFATVMRATLSQRLCAHIDGGRVAALEILIGTATIREFIMEAKASREIFRLMEEGSEQYGMQTFDMALYDLFKKDMITQETALLQATSSKDLKLRIDGYS
ncbi:type IV pilus twitching motility protein PilT [Candidatus Hydrogenedentota bacterium]